MTDRLAGLVTIQDFIRWGASRFNETGLCFGHGLDNALDEAVELVLAALHLPPDFPADYRDCRLTGGERVAVTGLLEERLRSRRPVPYLTGRARFAGLDFQVTEDVLVPRSPLAELIEAGFAPWADPLSLSRVLDLGTGSGCIGIAIACHLPDTVVDLVDISPAALAVAGLNLERYSLGDRVRVIESDLFSALSGNRYDLIVSNPPYVAATELADLPPEFAAEPELALAGGADGLDLVKVILAQAAEHLAPDGLLIVEVGTSAPALVRQFPEVPFTWLDFERGGDGVFLLPRQELVSHAHSFTSAAQCA